MTQLGHWLAEDRILNLGRGTSDWIQMKLLALNPQITLSHPCQAK